MTIITIAAAGIATVLLAVQLKGLKGEYAAYMVMAAGAFIFFYGTGKLRIYWRPWNGFRAISR